MRIVELQYNEDQRGERAWDGAALTAARIAQYSEPKLRRFYQPSNLDTDVRGYDLGYRLTPLLFAQPDLATRQQSILDIGCGSGRFQGYPPWISRTLRLMDHSVVGLDMFGPTPQDTYRWVEGDIGEENVLQQFAPGSFDVVCAFYCFDNDTLIEKAGEIGSNTLRRRMLEEVPRLLRPNGVFVYNFPRARVSTPEYT